MVERARMNVHYVVATIKPWNIEAFHRRCAKLPGQWELIELERRFKHRCVERNKAEVRLLPALVLARAVANST